MDSKKIKAFENAGFYFGRMISGSKSLYANRFPDHQIVFNARIYDPETYEKEKSGKIKDFFAGQNIEIWYGDLDLTQDGEKLKEIANKIGSFIITTEFGKYVTTIEKCT